MIKKWVMESSIASDQNVHININILLFIYNVQYYIQPDQWVHEVNNKQ